MSATQVFGQPPVVTPISSHTFTHDAFGRMTYDGTENLDIAYNHLDLPEKISRNDTVLVKYAYLSDGMKASTLNTAGAGLVYRGFMSFRKDSVGVLSFESAPIPAGRVTANGVRYHVTDHLGSVRAVVNGETGILYEASDYAAYGHRTAATSLPNDVSVSTLPAGEAPSRWHFTGQEDQGPVSASAALVPNPANAALPYTDFGARHYSPSLRRWLVPDPLSEKYYDVSPYAYCAGDPVNCVDVGGEIPRLYVQKSGLTGHAFVTIGEAKNTVVYTYGRYGELFPVSSHMTSGQLTPTGEGVLGVLSGDNARSYLMDVFLEDNVSIYEFPNVSEQSVSDFFQQQFNTGSSPTNIEKRTYNNPDYKVIDQYDVLKNNCVTTSIEAIEQGGAIIHSNAISPRSLDKDLFNQSLSTDNKDVQFVPKPMDYLRSLILEMDEK